jgi:spore coat polysaccharide biosynthesis predicted glycosyltransferase SpsG
LVIYLKSHHHFLQNIKNRKFEIFVFDSQILQQKQQKNLR